VLPSKTIPFLSVETDGRSKDRHNREILYILDLLLKSGVKVFCTHHVSEAMADKRLPMAIGAKWYDISYVSSDGEIIMLEIMRTRSYFDPEFYERGKKCQKRE
jgi:hypothetical protein